MFGSLSISFATNPLKSLRASSFSKSRVSNDLYTQTNIKAVQKTNLPYIAFVNPSESIGFNRNGRLQRGNGSYHPFLNARFYHTSRKMLESSSEVVENVESTPLNSKSDITKKPLFTAEKEEISQYLTVISEEEYVALSRNLDFIKADRENSPVPAFRKLFHYYLNKNDSENAQVHFNDLIRYDAPLRFEIEYLMTLLIESEKFDAFSRLYRIFKDSGLKPTEQTFGILFKGFGESGKVDQIMEIYESSFAHRLIPSIDNIFCIVKCAAIGGDPKTFFRFYTRIYHKGSKVSKKQLQHFSDVWGTYPVLSEYCKSIHVNAYDFSKTIDLILRVRNYRLAIDLIYECRDVYNIQPDAMMYETFLEGCIRDGFLREKARAWKRRFHKYPKGIEVRTEHFEFAEFIKEVEEYLGDNIAKATPTKEGVHFKPNRTTKKSSRQFYKYYPNTRYTSIFEKMDKYDWVPEYVKRKEEAALIKVQQEKATYLDDIERVAQIEQEELQKLHEESQGRVYLPPEENKA